MREDLRPKKLTVDDDQRDFEVTLRFRIRRGGNAGNDPGMFQRAFGMLVKVLPLFDFVQYGDENVAITDVRWRRPGEAWQQWHDDYGRWPVEEPSAEPMRPRQHEATRAEVRRGRAKR